VNDVELTGMAQSEVIALLRNIPCVTSVDFYIIKNVSNQLTDNCMDTAQTFLQNNQADVKENHKMSSLVNGNFLCIT